MNTHRMRQLAGIQEVKQVEDPDEVDRRDDEVRQREAKIEQLIALAFRRIDLAIADDGIFYDEAEGREATVMLDDPQIDLDRLAKLKETGLAASYAIWGTARGLSVEFSVDPGLDYAKITPPR